MLQIVTGRFFRPVKLYETLHRGVLFTNYVTPDPIVFETPIGRILPSTRMTGAHTFTHEIVEKLEAVRPDGGMEALISTNGEELIADLAVVLSFVLDISCTTDAALLDRLTAVKSSRRAVRDRPAALAPRRFDEQVWGQDGDAERVNAFMSKLVSLERKTFEAVMRAMRQFVFAGDRLADDLSLAYVLLVMSIESLAQSFEGPAPEWADYDPGKAKAIDRALADASPAVAEAVRAAILANEHVAVSRRFRDFVGDHVTPAFFRDEAVGRKQPPSRRQLGPAIERAYAMRSAYVHRLATIPAELWSLGGGGDTVTLDRRPHLTFAGLSRVARHAILQVVWRAEPVQTEAFDWRRSLPNIIWAPVAAQHWLGLPEALASVSAQQHLEAMLEQLVAWHFDRSDAPMIDLRRILDLIEQRVGSDPVSIRADLLLVYELWHAVMHESHHRPDWKAFLARYERETDAPRPALLAANVVLGATPPWSAETLDAVWAAHVQARGKSRLTLPRTLDAAMALVVAEAVRAAGDEARARDLIAAAVEAYPGHAPLIDFEAALVDGEPLPSIAWIDLLCAPVAKDPTMALD